MFLPQRYEQILNLANLSCFFLGLVFVPFANRTPLSSCKRITNAHPQARHARRRRRRLLPKGTQELQIWLNGFYFDPILYIVFTSILCLSSHNSLSLDLGQIYQALHNEVTWNLPKPCNHNKHKVCYPFRFRIE